MLKLTTVNQCYIYLTVLGESIECEQYSAVGVKCKSYIEYICSAFELLLLMLISYLLSTLDDQLYRLVLPNLKKIYVYQKEKKTYVFTFHMGICSHLNVCYNGRNGFLLSIVFTVALFKYRGSFAYTFFETLEKQPCKQRSDLVLNRHTLDYLINEHARLVLVLCTKQACSFIR